VRKPWFDSQCRQAKHKLQQALASSNQNNAFKEEQMTIKKEKTPFFLNYKQKS